jgi:membrane protease YdiL (CAAX protease family)
MNTFKLLIQRHPLLIFFVLTYAISWVPALMTAVVPGFSMLIFAAGPSVAALIVTAIEGKTAWQELWRRALCWRVGWGWYAVALLSPLPFYLAAVGLNTLLGAPAPTAAQWATWPSLFTIFASFLFVPLRGAWEEGGWRSYALPKLLAGRSALTASLILGMVWALWHLPLFVTGQTHWLIAFLILPLSIIFTWLFNHTSGSALLAFLFHAAFDTFGEFFIPLVAGADQVRLYWLLAALAALIAAVIVSLSGPALRRPATAQANVRAENSLALP